MPKTMIVSRKQVVKPKAKLTRKKAVPFWIYASGSWHRCKEAYPVKLRGFEQHPSFVYAYHGMRRVGHPCGYAYHDELGETPTGAVRNALAFLRKMKVQPARLVACVRKVDVLLAGQENPNYIKGGVMFFVKAKARRK